MPGTGPTLVGEAGGHRTVAAGKPGPVSAHHGTPQPPPSLAPSGRRHFAPSTHPLTLRHLFTPPIAEGNNSEWQPPANQRYLC